MVNRKKSLKNEKVGEFSSKTFRISLDSDGSIGANLRVSLVGRRVQRFGGLVGSLRHQSLHVVSTLEAMDLAPFALNPAVEALARLIMFDINRWEVKLKTCFFVSRRM